MNDVLHHCVRKYADELKQSLESVAVEMFCAAWTSSNNDNGTISTERESAEARQLKLSKLIKLWEDQNLVVLSQILFKFIISHHNIVLAIKLITEEDFDDHLLPNFREIVC